MSMHRRPEGRTTIRLALLGLSGAWLAALPVAELAAQEITGYELAIVDSRGKKQVLGRLPASAVAPRVSPEGDKIAIGLADPAQPGSPTRVWIADLEEFTKRSALPSQGTGANVPGAWTADNKQVVVSVAGNGADVPSAIYRQNADGKGQAEKLGDGAAAQALSADGKQLAFLTLAAEGDYGISSLDLESKAATKWVDLPKSAQQSAAISPDGKWLAYTSNDTGESEVWLERLPTTGKRYRMTNGGGRHPVWSADGYQVYYDQNGQIQRLFIFLDKEVPQAGELEKLPITNFAQNDLHRPYDLMPDGVRLLMLFPVK